MNKNANIDEELKELRRDLNAAYKRGDKTGAADIQDRIDALTPSKKNWTGNRVARGAERYASKNKS